MTGFVFYDFETTGRSPAFDQALQFAAIYTDEDFVELERVNIRSRLLPYILPAPKALEITGIDPNDTLSTDLPNAFEFAQKLQYLTEKWSPACWVGFNSVSFDENFLRQIFYQNLQPNIYATQNHGNTRHDLMNIVYGLCTAPETLIWPEDEIGKNIQTGKACSRLMRLKILMLTMFWQMLKLLYLFLHSFASVMRRFLMR